MMEEAINPIAEMSHRVLYPNTSVKHPPYTGPRKRPKKKVPLSMLDHMSETVR